MTTEEAVERLRVIDDAYNHARRHTEKGQIPTITIQVEDMRAIVAAAHLLEEDKRQDAEAGRAGRECAVLLGIAAAVVGIIMTMRGRVDAGIGLCLVAAVWWLEAIVTGRRNDRGQ